MKSGTPNDIAVIGLACRFPGAADPDTFWANLINGRESITFFSPEELVAAGVAPELLSQPAYVPARGVVPGIELFDATALAMTPAEAALTDPQQRLLLECAWEALENGGCDPDRADGPIGIYAAAGANNYLHEQVLPRLRQGDLAQRYQAIQANEKDFLATRIAYKLNLTGPAITVQTACSSSLVAVHCACQAIIAGECDLALAGGVALFLPQEQGYLHQEGMILSPDGHCRAFDAAAAGTVVGSGAGMVLLKRLADVLADRDFIHGVIRGSAVNNDGAAKVGFTAPGIDGQVRVIREALAVAEVAPEEIGYLEAHGTGTPMGDPVEIAALGQAFGLEGRKQGVCLLGSVKTNIGHCDAAAGIAGLIKILLALRHRQIPPSLHFKSPNPAIDFAATPFEVCDRPLPWPSDKRLRLAGVSSFGMGGTNAHLVVQQAPSPPLSGASAPRPTAAAGIPQCFLLPLSARTPSALRSLAGALARHLEQQPAVEPADLAVTLQLGRRQLNRRGFVVCRDSRQAVAALKRRAAASASDEQELAPPTPKMASNHRVQQHGVDDHGVYPHEVSGQGVPQVAASGTATRAPAREPARSPQDAVLPDRLPEICFMFPGQGSQFVGMGRELYAEEEVFGATLDRCAEIVQPLLGEDLRRYVTGCDQELNPELDRQLQQTALTQPVLFAVEYAYACQLQHWGIRPRALIGHSLGEYVAACLAGIFSLEDALALVTARGALMQRQPPGMMVAVQLREDELAPLLAPGLSLAASNGASCTLSGSEAAVSELIAHCRAQGIAHTLLATSHAFHSEMFTAAAEEFAALVAAFPRQAPRIPVISNLSGAPLTAEEACSADYWARHLRQPVRFSAGLDTLLAQPSRLLLEVGPGTVLSSLARRHRPLAQGQRVVAVGSHPREQQDSCRSLLTAVGELWRLGAAINWSALAPARGRRIPLPTYPFERSRHWFGDQPIMEPPAAGRAQGQSDPAQQQLVGPGARLSGVKLFAPSWRRLPLPFPLPVPAGKWLLLARPGPNSRLLDELLRGGGVEPIMVDPKQLCAPTPAAVADPWSQLVAEEKLLELLQPLVPGGPLHLVYDLLPWGEEKSAHRGQPEMSDHQGQPAEREHREQPELSGLGEPEEAVLAFTRALVRILPRLELAEPLFLNLLTNGIYEVSGQEPLVPQRAALPAIIRSLTLEYPLIQAQTLDCGVSGHGMPHFAAIGPAMHDRGEIANLSPGEPSRLPEPEPAASRDRLPFEPRDPFELSESDEPGEPLAPLSRRWRDNLAAQLINPAAGGAVALRGSQRWQEHYQPVEQPPAGGRIVTGGTYLLTGGLGDLGLAVAEHLAAVAPITLVLTRKTPFPPSEKWDSWLAEHGEAQPTSVVIRRLRALEQRGTVVLPVAVDVCSRPAMAALLAEVERRFGKIRGCIHAAGLTGGSAICPYAQLSREHFRRLLAPKEEGYQLLQELLGDSEPDFLVAVSSLSAWLGGRGMAAYAAANAVLAARITADNRAGGRWLCLDWDGWNFVNVQQPPTFGRSAQLTDPGSAALGCKTSSGALLNVYSPLTQPVVGPGERSPDFSRGPAASGGSEALARAIPAAIAVELLQRLTAWPGGERLLVVGAELAQQLRVAEAVVEKSGAAGQAGNASTNACQPVQCPADSASGPGAAGEGADLEAEEGPAERLVRAVWQAVLGVAEITPEENFFALGGSSLQLVQVHSRLQEALACQFPLRHLFEEPGFAMMTELVRRLQPGAADRPDCPDQREEMEF